MMVCIVTTPLIQGKRAPCTLGSDICVRMADPEELPRKFLPKSKPDLQVEVHVLPTSGEILHDFVPLVLRKPCHAGFQQQACVRRGEEALQDGHVLTSGASRRPHSAQRACA